MKNLKSNVIIEKVKVQMTISWQLSDMKCRFIDNQLVSGSLQFDIVVSAIQLAMWQCHDAGLRQAHVMSTDKNWKKYQMTREVEQLFEKKFEN